ncbi:MAG: GHKL domain-containing protein [Planctomycetes bacterium]|nr:GHKL domain-containing protein [Planctomycetota bacterium]
MSRSLRTRLLIGIIIGMILLLTIFSLLIYVVIRSTLVKQFDTSLTSVAQILAASVEIDGDEIELDFEAQQMPEFLNAEHPTHYQLWAADGTVIAKSPLLGLENLLRVVGPLNAVVPGISRDKNGQPQRTVGITFIPRLADSHDEDEDEDDGDKDKDEDIQDYLSPENVQALTLVVARDVSDLYGQLGFLRWLLLNASAAVIALSCILAAVIVRRGLRPLNAIAAEIATIKEDSLTTRITTEDVPTEVVQIKKRLNELLSRLQASFNRERQFNADVAHELRTPLSGLLSTIEVTLTRNRDNDEYKRVLFDCQAIVESMQMMVSNLLMLARLDAKQISFQTEKIRLDELVNSCWKPFSEKALERQVKFENNIKTETTCESDRQNLSIVLSNVFANAVEYADKGGQIRSIACRKDDSLEITVSNTGCKLTTDQVSKVFDCFWRDDLSRTDTGTHCGLGLALVLKLVRALNGNVIAELQPGGIFVVRIILPV